jgi:L-alanine-DL-glutamate epimerase-like enolase superfamily enzyme
MKPAIIKAIYLFKATSPQSRPIADSTHQLAEVNFCLARVELTSGVTGDGYLVCFQHCPNAILGALRDAANIALGVPVYETGKLLKSLSEESEYFGDIGLLRWAAGLINLAMWDAWGKTLGRPIWKLFGAYIDRVPVYGSGGWLSYSVTELMEEVVKYVKQGYRAVKIKVGMPDLQQDLERLAKVREAVGPDIRIMIDANQGLDVSSAIALSKQAAAYNIHWFEEPIDHRNFAGYQTLHTKCDIPLAMGEREFDTTVLCMLSRCNAVDIWQPDIIRLGGVQPWRNSAAAAYAFHLPVAPHFYKEYDVPLLCTIPNGLTAESFDWVDALIDNPLQIKDGFAYPNDKPGWGFSFLDDKLIEVK